MAKKQETATNCYFSKKFVNWNLNQSKEYIGCAGVSTRTEFLLGCWLLVSYYWCWSSKANWLSNSFKFGRIIVIKIDQNVILKCVFCILNGQKVCQFGSQYNCLPTGMVCIDLPFQSLLWCPLCMKIFECDNNDCNKTMQSVVLIGETLKIFDFTIFQPQMLGGKVFSIPYTLSTFDININYSKVTVSLLFL